MKRLLSAAGILLTANALVAESCAKENPSRLEEKRWIDAVKNRKVNDGATVGQVLNYAEQLRPRQFKVQRIGLAVDSGTGEPEAVAILYWIGMKRSGGDAWLGFSYNVKRNGPSMEVDVPENPLPQVPRIIEAMELGRDSFLRFIDKMYREECIDFETKKKLC